MGKGADLGIGSGAVQSALQELPEQPADGDNEDEAEQAAETTLENWPGQVRLVVRVDGVAEAGEEVVALAVRRGRREDCCQSRLSMGT
jgi:hypothetical protein